MESINLLLSQALSPYQVTLTSAGMRDDCLVTVKNPGGAIVVEREVDRAQLSDKRALVDVVDCLLRDLKIAEGAWNLQSSPPCATPPRPVAAPWHETLFFFGTFLQGVQSEFVTARAGIVLRCL